MDDLYQDNILDHYKHPRNYGTLEQPSHSRDELNPLCGDRLHMDLQVVDGVIEEVRFSGRGCAISQAAASMLTEELEGKHVDQALAIAKEDVLDLLGIPIGPVRLKCALLSLKALKAALYGIDAPEDDGDAL
jgi:nitrogen fixation NifU-like protein